MSVSTTVSCACGAQIKVSVQPGLAFAMPCPRCSKTSQYGPVAAPAVPAAATSARIIQAPSAAPVVPASARMRAPSAVSPPATSRFIDAPKPIAIPAQAAGYTKVQCIAYEISSRPTGMGTTSTDDDFYKGIWASNSGPCWDDAKGRVRLFEEALLSAAASGAVDPDPSTLKVFMAPEFLLRGPRGAYQLETLVGTPSQPGLFADLSALVRGDAWKHWFVVFGTVVGYVNDGADDAAEDAANGIVACYNCACAQLGGWNTEQERDKGAVAIMKTFKSGIDFLKDPQGLNALGGAEVQHMSYDEANTLVGFQMLDGDGIFEVGGVTIGLEICLDHACQRLKLSTPEPGNNLVQLQLIPSCGMSLQFKSICVQQDGLCFGVDGLSSGFDGQANTGAATHSQLYVVPSGPAKRFRQKAAGGNNTYLKQAHLSEKGPVTKVLAHAEDWQVKLGELYDTSVSVPPTICVYESLPLPPKMAIAAA